jgi:hypothetical protein
MLLTSSSRGFSLPSRGLWLSLVLEHPGLWFRWDPILFLLFTLAGLSSIFSTLGVFSPGFPHHQPSEQPESNLPYFKMTTSPSRCPDNHDRCREEEGSREGDEVNSKRRASNSGEATQYSGHRSRITRLYANKYLSLYKLTDHCVSFPCLF